MRQPDLSAPRFRPTRFTVMSKKFYRLFKKKHPEYAANPNSELKKIITPHSVLMYNEIINNRNGVELPEGLGYVFIGTCKPPKKHNTDYPTSIKYKTLLQHRNFESDSYVAKIFYTNYANKYKFRDREIWQFKGIRDFTRLVAKNYPENWKKYVEVENYQMINNLYRKRTTKQFFEKKHETDVIDYNEFDMD
jgi:hypothetical protein